MRGSGRLGCLVLLAGLAACGGPQGDVTVPIAAHAVPSQLAGNGAAPLSAIGPVTVAVSDLREAGGVGVLPGRVDEAATDKDWPHAAWEKLRAENRLAEAEALLLLRENALDGMGRQYSPARDFLATGLIGLAVGAANRGENYQPGFVVVAQGGLGGGDGGGTGDGGDLLHRGAAARTGAGDRRGRVDRPALRRRGRGRSAAGANGSGYWAPRPVIMMRTVATMIEMSATNQPRRVASCIA